MAVISRRTRNGGIGSRRSAPAYVSFVAILVTFVLSMSGATANAAVDSSNSIVDGTGNTLTVTQADTAINFVQPLDGNPLTREWYHNGVASYSVSGPDAAAFGGGITIGYQVGYPATFNGQITFNYSTPSLSIDSDGTPSVGNLIPSLGLSMGVGFGPGIQDIKAATGAVTGDNGSIRIGNFHGTVTGVVGETTIRPYVTLVSSKGDSVTTYGPVWKI